MSRYAKTRKILYRVLLFLVFIAAVFSLTNYLAGKESVQYLVDRYGYAGIFVGAIISGFNLVVPIPIITFMPLFLDAGFSFWSIIFVVSLGMTTGDALSIFLGYTGRYLVKSEATSNHWVYKKLVSIREQHALMPYLFLFVVASFVPLPNEVTVLPMSFLGYRAMLMIPIVFIGNIIFNYLTASGVIVLFNLVG